MDEFEGEPPEERAARKARERTEIDQVVQSDHERQARKARLLEEATRQVDAQLEVQIEFEAEHRGVSLADYRNQRLAELAAYRGERIHERWSELLLSDE